VISWAQRHRFSLGSARVTGAGVDAMSIADLIVAALTPAA